MSMKAQVGEALARTGVMALGTTNPDGSSWITPLGYQLDTDSGTDSGTDSSAVLTLNFLSPMVAQHVCNLPADQRVSVAIYGTAAGESALGLQIRGRAALTSDGGHGWQRFTVVSDEIWFYDSRIDQRRHQVDPTDTSA